LIRGFFFTIQVRLISQHPSNIKVFLAIQVSKELISKTVNRSFRSNLHYRIRERSQLSESL